MNCADAEGNGTPGYAPPLADVSGRLADVAPDCANSGPKSLSSRSLDLYSVAPKSNERYESITATDFAAL